MATPPTDDEPTETTIRRVSAERVLDQTTRVEHGQLVDADVNDGLLELEVEVPVGTCPACGAEVVGSTAWNGAHDRTFVCPAPDEECGVERFKDPAGGEEGDA